MKPEDKMTAQQTGTDGQKGTGQEGAGQEGAGQDGDGQEPSAIVRNLGLIKAASVIMGFLIIILTAVLVATVISRLSASSAPPASLELALPKGAKLRAASADDDGYVVVVDMADEQQVWRLSPTGERLQTIGVTTD